MPTPELDVPSRATGRGYAASVRPVSAQAITTDTHGLVAGAVSIPVGGFPMPAYRAMPAQRSGLLPVLLLVSEIFGVHEHIADVARRFAKQGYLAIAPELFVRQGDASAYTDMNLLIAELVSKVPDAQVLNDLDACVSWAAAEGGDVARLGVTGFCWGGRVTWLFDAHNAAVKAAVAWYGKLASPATELQPRRPVDVAAQLHAPVLGLYGGADPSIPLDTIDKMKSALAAGGPASKASEIVIYPDAPHAFHADYRPSYRQAAAEDGWRRCLDWFRAHGVA